MGASQQQRGIQNQPLNPTEGHNVWDFCVFSDRLNSNKWSTFPLVWHPTQTTGKLLSIQANEEKKTYLRQIYLVNFTFVLQDLYCLLSPSHIGIPAM